VNIREKMRKIREKVSFEGKLVKSERNKRGSLRVIPLEK